MRIFMDTLFTFIEWGLLAISAMCIIGAFWSYFYGHSWHIPSLLVIAALVFGAFTVACMAHNKYIPETFTGAMR